MKRTNVDMLNGSIAKGLLSLTAPIMIMNVLQSLFNIIDMRVLSVYSNDSSVGAVGACSALTVLSTTLLIGLSTGANIIVARRIGEGNKEQADRAVMTSLLIAVVGGLGLMVLGSSLAEPLLRLINCPESLLEKATIYLKMYFYGVPFSLLSGHCVACCFQTAGYSQESNPCRYRHFPADRNSAAAFLHPTVGH